jgi:hypothetical protein
MSANKKIEALLIGLDEIFDTRLGTIRRMGVEHAQRILTPEYLVREIDEFEGIDNSAFKELYRARNVETLQVSTITAIVPRLKDWASFLSELAMARPYFDGIKLVVNVWPYHLSSDVLRDIGSCVSVWTGGLTPIELVNISPQDLTPAFVKEQFAAMFMYEYGSWMELHSAAFHETRLSEIHLIAPALYFNEKPDEKTLKELIREAAHPFQAAMMLARPLVGLEIVDTKYFSVVEAPNKAH